MLTDTLLILAGLVTLFFVIRGAFRGLSGELAPLLGIACAVAALWIGHPWIRHLAAALFPGSSLLATVLTAAAVGLIVYFLTAKLARHLIGFIIPQPFNALLGILVGLLKSFILISIACGTYRVAAEQFETLRTAPLDHPLLRTMADLWADRFRAPPETLRDAALRTVRERTP